MSLKRLVSIVPVLFVRDIAASTSFFEAVLGFGTDFLAGDPPHYASVSRDGARLHLRCVEEPNFAELAARNTALILAMIEVSDVHGLFEEYAARGATFAQTPIRQPWGGTDFHVRDPDGNVIDFVAYD